MRLLADGSSPPARGTLVHDHLGRGAVRFIPACAGNTPRFPCPARPRAVHPRLRGEHPLANTIFTNPPGSSPPARGTLCDAEDGTQKGRFIPACAGNTGGATPMPCHRSVHPRLRGEHRRRKTPRSSGLGSSPPARGTREMRGWSTLLARFIPACAGNTPLASPRLPCTSVHPRLRGEHSYTISSFPFCLGSSPPARGTPHIRDGDGAAFRFIPACAGNTRASEWRQSPHSVHPRLRGEHRPLILIERT